MFLQVVNNNHAKNQLYAVSGLHDSLHDEHSDKDYLTVD